LKVTDTKIQKQQKENTTILILTPTGRDAQLVCQLLDRAGMAFVCCDTLKELTALIAVGKGPAIIADEALSKNNQGKELLATLQAQPEWLDTPLLILRGSRHPADCVEELAERWNVMVLQRPLKMPVFLSVIRSAVLARRRQISLKQTTEQLKAANEMLEQTRDYLSEAQKIAQLGSWDWNLSQNMIHWSDVMYDIFGVSPENFKPTYEGFRSFVHPDDRNLIKEAVDSTLQTGKNYDMTYRVILPDKTEHILHGRAKVIYDKTGKPVRMVGTTQDITERVRQQQELRNLAIDLEEQAQLLELAHDAIFVHDLDGKITYWNRGAENAYGFSRDEVIGKVSHELLKTRFPESLVKIIGKLISADRWDGELTHTTKQGRKITVESRWALRQTEHGEPAGILEIDRDITERKQTELRIQEARRYAESIIETVQVALLVLSPELKVLSANKTFYDTFCTNPQKTEGKFIYDLGNRQWDISELRVLLDEILPKNTCFEDFEVEQYFENIGWRTMLLNARRLYQRRGKTQLILLSIQDITQLKLQQKRIAADQERIASLTEELLLAEEKERRRIAVDLHDSVGQILAFSKREIGVAQKAAPAALSQNLTKIKKQINNAIKHTRDLTFELSPQTLYTFGLEAAIEELAEKFSDEHGLACYFDADEEPKPLTEQLRILLYRCVRELLMNIVKHAKAKDAHVSVKRTNTDIEITVADSGQGFNPAILESAANKKKFGLVSIRERLRRSGGQFNLQSGKGKGVTIVLTVPLDLSNIKEKESLK
jgi:PAS domain S-box-containing protein